MRVILDECLPKRLGRLLVGHTTSTVTQAGWSGVKNGALLKLIDGAFDAFVTVDKSLPHQQNVADLSFVVVVLRVPSNTLKDLQPLIPAILDALDKVQPGGVVIVGL